MMIEKLLKNKFLLHKLSVIQEPWYSMINTIANGIFLLKKPERKQCLGTLYPDKTFYVINNPPYGGFAAQYDAVLGYLNRAYKKGYTPIIDFREVSLWKSEEQEISNFWEYYFKQPTDISLEEVYRSQNVIFHSQLSTIYTRKNKKNICMRHRMSQKVWFNDATQCYIDAKIKELGIDFTEQMIGAYYRGTDYKKNGSYVPAGHAIVPDIEQFCDILEQDCRRWNCRNVFFMTEEKEALDFFVTRFPNAKYVKKQRISNYKPGIMVALMTIDGTTRFENNLLYLTDLYILSKCHYVVGTWNGGIRTALNWNNNEYLDTHIIDLGTL